MEILSVNNVTKCFGGLVANSKVSLHVNEGEIIGLIGPNGAGKTTLFNCIAGDLKINEGTIQFMGHDINNLRADQICKKGIARTYQIMEPFKTMTVTENIMIGAFSRIKDVNKAKEKANKLLEFTGLYNIRDTKAGTLTTADLKRLEMARALATEPSLLLLDEVGAGLNPSEMAVLIELIRKIKDSGVSILVVEHVMELILSITDRVYVLSYGKLICEGAPEDVMHDENVIKVYLGEKKYA